jgi:hypothetical protein
MDYCVIKYRLLSRFSKDWLKSIKDEAIEENDEEI